MTLRAKPVTRRPGRPGWDAGDRRTTMINAGFAIAIVVSILILLGYAGWTWFDNHYGAAGAVDGQTITKDQLRTRINIEAFRINYTEGQVRALLAKGELTQSVATQQLQFLDQRLQSLTSIALENLIDNMLQAKLANDAAISVSDSDVDAQLTKEATTEELRHVWMIEVQPATDPLTGQVGEAQKAAAKAKADAALADLKAGKAWENVAKTASTAASAPQAGDLSYMPLASGYDTNFMTAVFAAANNTPTAVIQGTDGVYRIGRVTDIVPSSVDQAFSAKIQAAGNSVADYRVAIRGDVIRQKLSDSVVADLSKPSLQRHVLQLYLASVTADPAGIKARHILFAPNHDPAKAATLAATDPAWAKAKADADAAFATLQADRTKFDAMARALSDDTTTKAAGGKIIGFIDSTTALDPAFSAAVLAKGIQAGDLIGPIKTADGWDVAQVMRPYGAGNQAFLTTLKTQADAGVDFVHLALDQGDSDSTHMIDLGWVAKGQLGNVKEGPIFAAAVGSTSTVVDIASDGDYLFKVIGEEMQPATPDQIAIFKQSGFTDWYSVKKGEAQIERDIATSATG
jgi:parvulin-like peptidyl-prolyl isomerase